MTTNSTGGVVLQRIKPTLLYEPKPPSPEEHLLFLRFNNTAPPDSIPLEQAWADSGLPDNSGYFLFLNAIPTDPAFFEDKIRPQLPEPTASAFAWAISGATPAVQTLLKTKLNNSNPCVDGDTPLSLPPGLEDLGFADNSPVLSITVDGFITGFVVTHPALTNPQANPLGLILPMTGPAVGCVQLQGLTSRFAQPPANDSAVKNLVNVSVDPHNPFDTQRNYMRFTGAQYILTKIGDSYSIAPAS